MTLALRSVTVSSNTVRLADNTASGARSMLNELPKAIDQAIERLLLEWWAWEAPYTGAPFVAISSIYSPASHVHDSATEHLQDSVNHPKLEAIGAAVDSLPLKHATAVRVQMRNLTAIAVWKSNRFDEIEQELLYTEAKVMLLPLLRKRHVEI